ncbi:MAG TPA: dihydroorotate dehydrogenase [Clostridia bacterium]|jgi:dihydroorotate dehydrogenase (NAD+) catalytic subunit|nr:dihydroorotate dehydrogenase [Clostridiaceae bacterium]HOF27470.1 dihydroorotate dehydrogenase [Clostridia bacterium]HOM35340.1 dihydroorotate dehydrogenase [Clostridia bacterium]HOR90576.1 dihydroorotate dehydrogenase [Clostridia bacterium]HOT71502.1 dihydroorotate dehydrogenase [Clostridia bacterium]
MVNLSVNLSGLTLSNPIIPASGCFGYGKEFSEYYDINILGSFCMKGTTKEPRFGNETPRIAESSSGMLNSVGLQNPGIEHVVQQELKEIRAYYSKPVIANISGFSVEEYEYCVRRLRGIDNVGLIEVNISCPNVEQGGMSFGTDPEMAAKVTKAVVKVADKPVYVKLTPNVTDITEIAKACESEGASGICAINTLSAMRIDIKKQKPVLANITGGLSGPAVFPVALRMVYQLYKEIKIPIIGIGGISKVEDVIEMMMAGATAVQIGSLNLVDPYICKTIINQLPGMLEQLGIDDINKIVGAAHR